MKKAWLLICIIISILACGAVAGAVTLDFLEVLTSPERTELLKGMIAEFEAANPDIKINLISPPYEQADQKLTLMLSANQKLDIIEVRDYTIKQFVNNGKLLDLTNYWNSWDGVNTLSGIALSAAKFVDDTPYILPLGIFIKALFMRDDVLANYGVNYAPKTVSELVEICRQITDPQKNQYGFAFRGKSAEIKFSDYVASSFVEAIKDSEYIYSEEKTFFTDPEYKLGMKVYIDLFKKGSPKDSINWGYNEQINGFVSGVTPFLLQDPDAIPFINQMLGEDKYSVVPAPVGPFGFTVLDYGFNGLGIPSYSEYKEEAWKFISWMCSPEKNGYFNEHYGTLPAHTITFEENEHFRGPHYQAFNYEMANPDKYLFKLYPLDSEKWPGWMQIHEADMQGLLLGNRDLDEVLTKWDKYWTE